MVSDCRLTKVGLRPEQYLSAVAGCWLSRFQYFDGHEIFFIKVQSTLKVTFKKVTLVS